MRIEYFGDRIYNEKNFAHYVFGRNSLPNR